MNFKPEYIFFGIFTLVACFFLFKIIKHGGLKAAMFGAGIEKTVGEISTQNGSKLGSTSMKVHELNDVLGEKKVGLELVSKSVASYHMMPISLSKTEADKLVQLISGITSDE